jgi:uncharacterized membrane protein
MNKRPRNLYNYYLAFLGVLTVLPMLAPILAKLGESISIFTIPAKIIYFVYSFTCHQFDHRSLHLFDYQYAWCGRETGLFLSFFVVSVLVKFFKIKRIAWYWVVPFMLGWLLDGGVQTVATFIVGLNSTASLNDPIYISSDLTRFMSGALFGIGLALFISTFMYNGFNEGQPDNRHNIADTPSKLVKFFLSNKYKVVITSFIAMLGIYTLLVGAWNITSVKYKPSDLWDTIVRTPANDFYVRRAHAICPTTTEDPLNVACFFK